MSMKFEDAKELLAPLETGAMNKQIVEKYLEALAARGNGPAAEADALSQAAWVKDFRDLPSLATLIVAFVSVGYKTGIMSNPIVMMEAAFLAGLGVGWLSGRDQFQLDSLERLGKVA